MKKIINESGVAFGEFNSDDLFYIEESDLYKSLGTGIKTVEFIVLDQKDTIIFLEAKTGCPNPQNKEMGGEKTEKFVEFYNDISEKFIDSLQIYIAGLLEKYGKTEEIGLSLKVDHFLLQSILGKVLPPSIAPTSTLSALPSGSTPFLSIIRKEQASKK